MFTAASGSKATGDDVLSGNCPGNKQSAFCTDAKLRYQWDSSVYMYYPQEMHHFVGHVISGTVVCVCTVYRHCTICRPRDQWDSCVYMYCLQALYHL